jgi:hypothetical protein
MIRHYKRRIGFAPLLCVDGPVHTDGSRQFSLAYTWTDGLVGGLPGMWPTPPTTPTKSRRPRLKAIGIDTGRRCLDYFLWCMKHIIARDVGNKKINRWKRICKNSPE